MDICLGRIKANFRRDLQMRELVRGSSWLLGASVISTLLNLVQGVFLARSLGPEGFGILILLSTYVAIVNQVFDSRSWEVGIKFMTQYLQRGDWERAGGIITLSYLVDAATSVITYLVIVGSAAFACGILTKSETNISLLQFYALVVLMQVPLGTSQALLRIQNLFFWLALQDVIFPFVQLMGIIWAISSGGGLHQAISVIVLVAMLKAASALVLSNRVARQLGLVRGITSLKSLKFETGAITRFWLATNAVALLKGLHRNLDTLLLGYWLGPAQVGIYRFARNLSEMLNFPAAPVYQTTLPEFARLWHQGKVKTLRRLAVTLMLLTSLVIVPSIGFLWLFGSQLVHWLGGEGYYSSVSVMNLLIIGTGIGVITQYGHALLVASGDGGPLVRAFVVPLLIEGILLAFLVPLLGLHGAAFAIIIFNVVRAVMLLQAVWGLRIGGKCSLRYSDGSGT